MPKDTFIYKNTRKLETKWKKYEKSILTEISRITGLPWRESHIYVYITSGVGWFSLPLTMSITKDIDFLFHTLVHEFIHRILSENENWPLIKNKWYGLMRKYRKEVSVTRIHIPIHAIHAHIYLKFFDRSTIDTEIRKLSKTPDYVRSWDIVKKEGYENILKMISLKK